MTVMFECKECGWQSDHDVERCMACASTDLEWVLPPIKKGQRIWFKEEWMDGDMEFPVVACEDQAEGDDRIEVMVLIPNFRFQPRSFVKLDMIERWEDYIEENRDE